MKKPKKSRAVLRSGVVKKGVRSPRGFGAGLMSDTKWRKVIAALDRPELVLEQVILKFVDEDTEHKIGMVKSWSLYPPRPYVDASSGPFSWRRLEWMEIPFTARYERSSPGTGRIADRAVAQDVDKAEVILTELGKLPISRTGRGLRIIGHIR